jgi:hypothetical protein
LKLRRKKTAYLNTTPMQFLALAACAALFWRFSTPAVKTFSLSNDDESLLKLQAKNLSAGEDGEPVAQLQSILSFFETRAPSKQDPFYPLQWSVPLWPTTQLDRFPYTLEQENPLLRMAKTDEFFTWDNSHDKLGLKNNDVDGREVTLPSSCPGHWPLTLGFSKFSDKLTPLQKSPAQTSFVHLGKVLTVLDGPVDFNHPEIHHLAASSFTQNVEFKETLALQVKAAPLSFVHGTHIVGYLSALRDGRGIAGILPGVSLNLLPFKLQLDQKTILLSDYLLALDDLKKMLDDSKSPSQVVLINAAIESSNQEQANTIREKMLPKLKELLAHKVILVVPAGNAVQERLRSLQSFPSAFASELLDAQGLLLSVGASDFCSNVAWFSKTPSSIFSAKIYAPGERIYATLPQGDYGFLSGTSLSAAQVAAALTVGAASAPQMSPRELVKVMVATSRTGRGLGASGIVPDVNAFWEAIMMNDE